MKRKPDSHKGENGTVAVIGGSLHQHGAPLFSALAAEASGVDLVYVFVPEAHNAIAKLASLNFQVHTFGSHDSDEMNDADRNRIIEFLATIDVAVVGPGLARTIPALRTLMTLIEEASCPLVLDASALQSNTLAQIKGKHAVLTPHIGELERMGQKEKDLPNICKEYACTVLLKSPTDSIIGEDGKVTSVPGGNAGLTVGGTGDALAGLTAGLIAQGMTHEEAAILASKTIKKCGDKLQEAKGFAYTTKDVINLIPEVLITL